MMGLKLSIIVPTYNEAQNLPELFKRIEAPLKGIPHEVIVVDDNSPDGTASVAQGLRKHGNVKVYRRNRRMGLSSAIMDGVKLAESDLIAVMDADLQHPPELLPRMLKRMSKGHDIVIASRYVEGERIKDWDLIRRAVSKGAIALAHLLLPKTRSVKDPISGFFLVKRAVIEHLEIINPSGFKILLEILARASYGSIAEVPYIFTSRRRGKSKLSLKEVINYVHFLLKLRRVLDPWRNNSTTSNSTVHRFHVGALI